MRKQKFGGIWTPQKLEVLERYLNFYKTALKYAADRFGWQLIYIDAFAGSGQCDISSKSIDQVNDTFFDEEASNIIDGSARMAINLEDPFDHYFFVEHKKKYFRHLEDYCRQHELSNRIHIQHADANDAIGPLINSINWKKTRGVMFLDPYGMQVTYELLQDIANSQALDVWYLFPLSGLYRQAANNYADVDKNKKAAITRCLGTDAWKTALYDTKPNTQQTLFGEATEPEIMRTAEMGNIIRFVKERLELAFPAVSDPKILLTKNNAPQFALFFAVSNPNKKAIERAMKPAQYIIDM